MRARANIIPLQKTLPPESAYRGMELDKWKNMVEGNYFEARQSPPGTVGDGPSTEPAWVAFSTKPPSAWPPAIIALFEESKDVKLPRSSIAFAPFHKDEQLKDVARLSNLD
jgi:hypothetical protein